MNIDFHPKIKDNDFAAMREHYKDYLYFHNYDTYEVQLMLACFDNLINKRDYETIKRQMRGIGVILISEDPEETKLL